MENVRPEEFLVLLGDDPVVDLYANRPWRIPPGTWARIRTNLEKSITEFIASWEGQDGATHYASEVTVSTHSWLRAEVHPRLADAVEALGRAPGAGAVVAGTARDFAVEILGEYSRTPASPDRDRLGFWISPGGWPLPGEWMLQAIAERPEARHALSKLLTDVPQAIAEIEPLRRIAYFYSSVLRLGEISLSEELDAGGTPGTIRKVLQKMVSYVERPAMYTELLGDRRYVEDAVRQLAAATDVLTNAVPRPAGMSTAADLALVGHLADGRTIEVDDEVPGAEAAMAARQLIADGAVGVDAWQDAAMAWLEPAARSGAIHASRVFLDAMSRLITIQQRGIAEDQQRPSSAIVPIEWFQKLLYERILPAETWRDAAAHPLPTYQPSVATETNTPNTPELDCSSARGGVFGGNRI